MDNKIKTYINNSIEIRKNILANELMLEQIKEISNELVKALKAQNKVLFVGNGGSASDCDHLATEFVSKFFKERHAFSAISLTSNNALITALSNDFGYDKAFSRQIEAIGKKGDVLIALSTSGNSKNIIDAIEVANKHELVTVGLTGEKPCNMDEKCSILVKIPSSETPAIQEAQVMLGHLICKIVEDELLS